MLSTLSDPAQIGVGMATALVTTFYGAVLANALFLPLAGKLETRSREEILNKEMVIDGIMAIQSGDSPRIVEEKLKSFLSPTLRRKVDTAKERAA
jgi:chemotaxis protein MotA